MKKLLLLISGLLLLFSVEGQILRYSNYTAPPPATVLVQSIDVWGTGGATTISTNGGTLQMLKKTLPTNAADTSATWSRTNGTGTANISAGGLLTALTNGTVTVRATANDSSAVYGEEIITISNQAAPNLLSNGTFDSSTGWGLTNVTISGGSATFTGNGSILVQTRANMNAGMTNSTGYKLEFDMTGAGFAFYFKSVDGGGTYFPSYEVAANGHNTFNFTSPSDWEEFWDGIRIECISDAGTYVMDNISITLQ